VTSRSIGMIVVALVTIAFAASASAVRADAPEGVPALRVAMFPIENLSDGDAPTDRIANLLRERLEAIGLIPLDDATTASFLRGNRVRWVGGINRELARRLRTETGVDAVAITSLDAYRDVYPPVIAMTARIVSIEDDPEILWMDSFHRSGDDSPGILDLGLIRDPDVLLTEVLDELTSSASQVLNGHRPLRPPWLSQGRFGLDTSTGSTATVRDQGSARTRVAVIPFVNDSDRPRAGEILALQTVRHLASAGTLDVIDPGVVRETSLRARVIQRDGLSTPQAELLRDLLEADLVITGQVHRYDPSHSGADPPVVSFSVRAVDTTSLQVVWAGFGYNRGDDGDVLFQSRRVRTAHELAFQMTRAAVREMCEWTLNDVRRRRRFLDSPDGPGR